MLWWNLLLPAPVVLGAIDLVRLLVELLVDLLALLRTQFAAVGSAVLLHFLVNLRFIVLEVRGFAGRELSAVDALRDAILLVLFPLADFTLRVGVLLRFVVLIVIDLLGELVLLAA